MTDTPNTFQASPTAFIPYQQIADLITTARESGFSPWLGGVVRYQMRWEGKTFFAANRAAGEAFAARLAEIVAPADAADMQPVYSVGKAWGVPGFAIVFAHDGGDSEEGAFDQQTAITAERVTQTLTHPAFARHLPDLIADNADAETADAFMQVALLNEIVFG